MTATPMQPATASTELNPSHTLNAGTGVIEIPSTSIKPQESKGLTLNWAFASVLRDIVLRTQGYDADGKIVDALMLVGVKVGDKTFTDGEVASKKWVGARIERNVPVEIQVANVSTTEVAIVGEIVTDPAQALPPPRAANPEIEAALARNRAREAIAAATLNAALGAYAKPGMPVGGFEHQTLNAAPSGGSAYAPYNPVPGNYAPPMAGQGVQAAPAQSQPIHGSSVSTPNLGGAHVPAVTIPTAPGAQPVHGNVVTASPGVHAPAIAPSTTGAPPRHVDVGQYQNGNGQNGGSPSVFSPVATAHTHLAMLVELAQQGAALMTADPPSDAALAKNHVALINVIAQLARAGLPGPSSGAVPPNSVQVHLTHGQAERLLKAARGEFLAGTERSDLPYPLEVAMGIRA